MFETYCIYGAIDRLSVEDCKTIISRVSDQCNLVLMGENTESKLDNGLTSAINKLKNEPNLETFLLKGKND